ncbi:MAG: PTS sugar transporter subunit IIA [Candidatus Alcyoniella australis]|nr:PTS sugar transporter subunit IIA [Candidatus Alcyoniella australis]
MQILSPMLKPELIQLDLEVEDKQALFAQTTSMLVPAGLADQAQRDELLRLLVEREGLGCTCVGSGVAIPHAGLQGLGGTALLLARIAQPLDYGEDEAGQHHHVDLVVLLVGPGDDPAEHLRLISRLCRMLKDENFLGELRNAANAPDVLRAFEQVEERHP